MLPIRSMSWGYLKLVHLFAELIINSNLVTQQKKILHLGTLWYGVIIYGTHQIEKIFMGHYCLGFVISGSELFIF